MRLELDAPARAPRSLIALCSLALAISAVTLNANASVRSSQHGPEPVEGVTNFGRVTDMVFRGGSVTPDGVRNLAARGVRTIVDLRQGDSRGEPEVCRQYGITYYRFSMSPRATPDSAAIDKILEIMRNARAPVYVHCSAGNHRTGTVCALYRMRVQGWPAERAWAEQEFYGFGPPENHPELFAFVYGSGLATTIVRPLAGVETEPIPHSRNAAPAIWVHPTDPEKSLILGADTHGGLLVYNLDGRQLGLVSDGSRPNHVDVLNDFSLGGRSVDLAVAGCRSDSAPGVKAWVIDPITATLSDATAGGVIPVLEGAPPYGSCVYRSARDGKGYFFVTSVQGQVEQYMLQDAGAGKITAARVRAFKVGSSCEGCVCDELGYFYLSEDRVGIWKFAAEPDSRDPGTLVAKAGENGLVPNVKGLALYSATGGRGYLIASSQGSSTFNVYAREGDNRYVLTVDPQADGIGDVERRDAIAVTSCPTSPRFAKGLFVAQDAKNRPNNQNFKLYSWEDLAGTRLLVDTQWSPRVKAQQTAPPSAAVALGKASDESRRGASPQAQTLDHERPASGGQPNGWAVESQPLEAETARMAEPGTVRLEAGFERQAASHRAEYNVPFALDYVASRRVELRLEPILYSHSPRSNRTSANGLGDLEMSATALAWPERGWTPGVAVAAEVKLPTARSRLIGSGKADYTGDMILSKCVAGFDIHTNLGYTLVGRPAGVRTRNVYSYALATERKFARFDAVAELTGHTPVLANPAASDAALERLPDIAGEELVGTLGGRYYLSDRVVLSGGVSYDSDHAVQIHPGLSIKFR